MTKIFRYLFTISMVLALTLVAFVPTSAASVSVIDFEGLAEGAIVSSVAYGAGISGDPVSGSVSVYGHNPVFAGTNAAMIFDAACPGGCSGQDQDLFNPAQGKVLIVSEDLDQTDPDDSDSPGQYFRFNFSGFATGVVTVESMVVGDVESVESGGVIRLYNGATLIKSVAIPVTGEGIYAIVMINATNVTSMRVQLRGSAAIDSLKVLSEEPPGGEEGCTPGYWKNHPRAWAVTGYAPTMTVEDVFDVPDEFGLDGYTLMQALSFQGGPTRADAARILLRAAVAAVLNAAHPNVDYPMTGSEIISAVNAKLLGTRGDMLGLKNTLNMYNNLGCPLN